ncbi:MAG TPA: pilus assembly protein TadG-related protein, partial [Abditibacterium sp.]
MFSISPTRFTDIKSRRRGSVLTLAALSMVALLGFAALAVDYGQLVVTRNHLQRACDAAALAGAAELPASTTSRMDMATYQAQNTAFQNKVLTSETTVTYPTPAPAANSNRIRVSATRNVPTLFARVLGITSNTVSTQAVAGRSALKGIPGNIPLAITVDDYNKFKDGTPFNERLIDNNRQDFTPDTITAVDLRLGGQGKSGAVFEEDLKYGYTGTTVIGDPVNSALNASLASQSQKLDSAITYRITESAKAPWYD